GHSLLPLMVEASPSSGTARAASRAARPAITEKLPELETGGGPSRESESFAIILDGWKLIHNTKRLAGRPEYELYDHEKALLDATDVAAQHPDVVQHLAAELQAWQRMASASRLPPDSKSSEGLGREELERLRALGYIQ